jgi:hypothetical protein
MTKQLLKSIAKKWIKAFQEHDIQKLLKLYDKNAKHYSPRVEKENPKTNGWLVGKKQLQKWWQSSFDKLPSLTYQLVDLTIGDNKVFMRYIRKVSRQQDLEVM